MCGPKPKRAPAPPKQPSQAELEADQRKAEEEEARKRAEEESKRIGRSNFRAPLGGTTGVTSGLSL